MSLSQTEPFPRPGLRRHRRGRHSARLDREHPEGLRSRVRKSNTPNAGQDPNVGW